MRGSTGKNEQRKRGVRTYWKEITMGKFVSYIMFVLMPVCFFASCGKDITPSVSALTKGKEYDSSAFDYVFVEAIRQKLMSNNGDALKLLEQCAEVNPESDAVYYQMAQIVLAGGDIKNGKKYAKKALELMPGNIWYIMTLAGIYYQEHKLDSAIIYYEQAVKNKPERVDLQLALGTLYSESRKYDKADNIFNNLDKIFGINEASTVANVKNLIRAEKYSEALDLVLKLLNEYPDEILYNGLLAEIYSGMGESEKAMDVYSRLMERNPDNPDIQLALCNFLISEKKYDELLLLINTVILNKAIIREDKISLFAEMIKEEPLVKLYGNRLLVSIMILEGAFPDDEIILLLRPELLIKEERLNDASRRLEEIIAINPGYYFAWELLLVVFLQADDYQNLEARGKECALRFNRSFNAKMLYATGAAENKKYDLALEEVRKAEILAGNNEEMIMQVLSVRADIYYKMKDYDRAFEIFEQAIKNNKKDFTVLNNYAYYLAEQNLKLKEAERMAKLVIENEKGNNTFLDTYGWVLYKRGKLREAEKVLQTIIESGGKPDAEWYEHMGYIKKKKRDCESAVENWNIALKLDSTKSELIEEIIECKGRR